MIHLRILAPVDLAAQALEVLGSNDAVINVIWLPGVALNPRGGVIVCDALSTQKSGALIGVLVSVTTLPAASYAGLAAAYGDWEAARGSLIQLVTNLVCIFSSRGWRPWGSSAPSTSAAGRVTCASADRAAGVRPARRTSARSADAGVLA